MKKCIMVGLCVLFSFMFCINCLGYAALSAELTVEGEATWTMPKAVIITNVDRDTDAPGDGTWDSSKTTYSQSILTSNVVLTNSGSSYVTLSVTVYNNTDVVQGLDKVIDGREEGFYSNEDIVYELTNLERKKILDKVFYDGTQIQPGTYHTFEVTFSYDGGKKGASPELDSVLNFVFKPYSDIVADEFVTPLEEGPLAQFKRILNDPVTYEDLESTIQDDSKVAYQRSYIGNVAGTEGGDDSEYVNRIFTRTNNDDTTTNTLFIDADGDGEADDPVTAMIKHWNIDGNTSTGTTYIDYIESGSWYNKTYTPVPTGGGEMILFMTPDTIKRGVSNVTVYAAVFTIPEGETEWVQLGEMYQGTANTNNYASNYGTPNSFNTETWKSSVMYYNAATGSTIEQIIAAYVKTQTTN